MFEPQQIASHSLQPSRRQVLRGLGTCLGLPFLESFGFRKFVKAAPVSRPLRAAWLYIPNGVNVQQWYPSGEGASYQLSPSLSELERHRSEVTVLSGLAQDFARSHGNGGGDHARATATFLTGCMPRKTAGADIQLGVSVDQIAAQKIGHLTRLPSLELSTDGQRSAGRCDSGYSCAYQFNLSWKDENTPMAPEMDPKLVFERLFGFGSAASGDDGQGGLRQRLNRSVLDTVAKDANRLAHRLSGNDKRKISEYLDAVRDIELRIERAAGFANNLPVGAKVPEGVPDQYEEHIRIMFDLLLLAFQSDTTRIASFMLAHDGSNRNFPGIGVPDGHHGISHHQGDAVKLDKLAKIDRFYLRQFAYFLDKLKATRETDGSSLLDHSMIVWGGGIADPDRHNHDNLPILLAGGAGGSWRRGHRRVLNQETPMTNLYVAMLERMGIRAEKVGDSNGKLELG